MRCFRGIRGSLLVGSFLAANSAAGVVHAATDDALMHDSADIVVMAQRRAENLQETPIAITALNPAKMETRMIESTMDLGKTVPNLFVGPVSGSRSTVQISMRGGSEQSGGIITSEAPVAIYIDDVYRGRLAGSRPRTHKQDSQIGFDLIQFP